MSEGDSFTRSPAPAPRSGLKPPTSNLLVLSLLRRHAWLAGPPANTCSRNNPQNKRQQHPNHRHSGISAARRGNLFLSSDIFWKNYSSSANFRNS